MFTRIPRIAGCAPMEVPAVHAEPELGRVRLAHRNRERMGQRPHHGSLALERRQQAFGRARENRDAVKREKILQGNRNSLQRPQIGPGRARTVGGFRNLPRTFGQPQLVGAERFALLLVAINGALGQFCRGNLAGTQPCRHFRQRPFMWLSHAVPRILDGNAGAPAMPRARAALVASMAG